MKRSPARLRPLPLTCALVLLCLLGPRGLSSQVRQWETREGELEPSVEVLESEEGPLLFDEEPFEPLFEEDLEGYSDQYEGPAEPIEIPLDASAHLEELADAEQEDEEGGACVPIIYACCGHFETGIEILSARPCRCDLDACIQDRRSLTIQDIGTLPRGDQASIHPDRDVGFRIFVSYVFNGGCLEGCVQYTSAHGKDSIEVCLPKGKGALWPTFGSPAIFDFPLVDGSIGSDNFPALVSAGVNTSYEAVDASLAFRWMKNPRAWGKTSFGLHYAHVISKLLVRYQGASAFAPKDRPKILTQGSVETDRNLFLIGPRVGLENHFELGCGFGLLSRCMGGVLAGRTRGEETQKALISFPTIPFEEVLDLTVRHRARCVVAPYAHLRLEGYWALCCPGRFKATIACGFEIWAYINVLARQTFNSVGGTASQGSRNVQFDTFYLRLSLELYK